MTKLQVFLLRWIARNIVIQGPIHKHNITEAYRIIYQAAKKEFYEDNKPTLDSFLQECFDDSKQGVIS